MLISEVQSSSGNTQSDWPSVCATPVVLTARVQGSLAQNAGTRQGLLRASGQLAVVVDPLPYWECLPRLPSLVGLPEAGKKGVGCPRTTQWVRTAPIWKFVIGSLQRGKLAQLQLVPSRKPKNQRFRFYALSTPWLHARGTRRTSLSSLALLCWCVASSGSATFELLSGPMMPNSSWCPWRHSLSSNRSVNLRFYTFSCAIHPDPPSMAKLGQPNPFPSRVARLICKWEGHSIFPLRPQNRDQECPRFSFRSRAIAEG